MRQVGQTKAQGFQIGLRKTVRCSFRSAWELVTSPEGPSIWSGGGIVRMWARGAKIQYPDGAVGEVRVFEPDSHIRLTCQPPGWERPSIIQVRVIDHGDRTVIAFHQEHIPDSKKRENRRTFFKQAVAMLEQRLMQ